MNLVPNFIRNITFKAPSSNKNFENACTNEPPVQRSIQVCLLGGHTKLGKNTCFLLKQNPLLTCVKIQGEEEVKSIGNDLNFIDTRCRIETFSGDAQIPAALRGADIVLILKGKQYKEDINFSERILGESKRVFNIAKQCTFYAPRSIVLVAIPPVSVFTPVVTEVFKHSNFYRPERIIGSAAIAQAKVNTMLGRYHDLDPYVCQVPIIGGPDMDIAVPLFSKAEPVELNYIISECLTGRFRHVKSNEFPRKHTKENFIENHDFGEAFALNNMISTICFGLLGDKKVFYNAFMRSNLVNTCRHLVTTLQFGRNGVSHNCGVPHLTDLELDLFERAIMEISKREKIAKEIVDFYEGYCEVPSLNDRGKEKKSQCN